MFRIILRQFTLRTSKIKSSQLQFSQSSQFTPSEFQRRPKEINNVKLRGTVFHAPFAHPNGSITFTLKTFEPNKTNYQHHFVRVNQKFGSVAADLIEVGQYISVLGKISSYPCNQGGETWTGLEIKADQLYLCNEDSSEVVSAEHTSSSSLKDASNSVKKTRNELDSANTYDRCFNDKNHVEILAHISSQIMKNDRFIKFNLATHHSIKSGPNEGTERKEFHKVYVYDDSLREYVRKQLNKSDRVVVEGSLGYKIQLKLDGKGKVRNGYIRATNIHKVMKIDGR